MNIATILSALPASLRVPVVLQWFEDVTRHLRGLPWETAASADVVLDFPSIAGGAVGTLSATIAGAELGGTVIVTPPLGFASTGLVLDGYVSAADTVLVRAANITAGAIDYASATYRITVLNHA